MARSRTWAAPMVAVASQSAFSFALLGLAALAGEPAAVVTGIAQHTRAGMVETATEQVSIGPQLPNHTDAFHGNTVEYEARQAEYYCNTLRWWDVYQQ